MFIYIDAWKSCSPTGYCGCCARPTTTWPRQSSGEVMLCLRPHISVDAIVRALVSRRRQTVLETVQHSSTLLTRVHIATGALWLPDLAPVDSDDQRGLFQVLQLSLWIEESRLEATSSFGSRCFQRHFPDAPQTPFLFRLRLWSARTGAFVRGVVELAVSLKLVKLVLLGSWLCFQNWNWSGAAFWIVTVTVESVSHGFL